MKEKLCHAQSLFKHEMEQLRQTHPSLNLSTNSKVLEILAEYSTRISREVNGMIEIEKEVRIDREVPVPDNRTKTLVSYLAIFVKRVLVKYPKLKCELDERIMELLEG